jgi:hypothetical protein
MSEQEWSIEHRKHGNEVYVVSSKEGIFVGEGYNKKERKRTHYLADIIVEALNKAENKQEDEKNREGWVCIHCGESTYDNDTEQLFSAIEHIGCALKAEAKAEGKVQRAIRLGNEVTDEENEKRFEESLKEKDSGHQPS